MTNDTLLDKFDPGGEFVEDYKLIIKMLDAAREDEAIRFAEWIQNGFIIHKGGGLYWQAGHDELQTTGELYLKYKKQNP